EEGRMVPFFQPILNLATNRIDKYECLVRMLDEQGNPISPMAFLPVARRIRLYRLITRSMIDQCLARFADSELHFSLNLACDDLLDEELNEYLLSRLQAPSLARRVIFEILESEGIENYQQVRRFIDRAKHLGCRIAIDDFGTGYSNFEHLLRLDVDLIKIDGSLIKRLDRDPTARALTEGIVRFARELGLQTVAEFVHSEALLQRGRELGIDFAQGSHIGMPAPTPVAAGLYSAPNPGWHGHPSCCSGAAMKTSALPLSMLVLFPVTLGSTPRDALRSSLDLARAAEQMGYHRFWVAEHHNMVGIASAATSVVIGYLAAGTERIRIGSGGIMLPNHSPLQIAE